METKEALTFNDILLVPNYSEILSKDVDLRSLFSRDIYLNIPFISAAMDTVTESEVAKVMAQSGGLGIIHKNMSVRSQAQEVLKVKKYESGMIVDPVTLTPEDKIYKAVEMMKKHSFSGFPVTVDGKLAGILTHRDIRFETDLDRPVKEIMTKDNIVTASEQMSHEEAKKTLHENRIEKLPVVDEKGILKGLITIKDIEKAKKFPMASKDSKGRLLVGAAVGVDEEDLSRSEALINSGVDVLVVDTAHGHSKNVLKMVEHLRKSYKDVVIVAGNVVTAEGVKELIKNGADVVKVGIGSGSICTTRVVTGVGVPQVHAVTECAQAAKKEGKSIIADGGVRYSGDATKVIAKGSDFVMLGNLLAGCDESPGEMTFYQGRTYKGYRGMGSVGAMKKGSKSRYFQSHLDDESAFISEGVEGRVSYKGPLGNVLYQLVGGVKSGMGYLGAKNIKELQKKARFVRISPQALKESHVHGVHITKESPNYRL